jgi:cell division septal protein FtsQ
MPNERRRRKGKVGFLLIFLVIAFALLLVFTGGLFFEVREITVEGAYAVSSAEVIALSGYAQGDNMFLINKAAATRAITAGMPYVRSVRIRRDWPGRVVIVISESAPAAMVEHRDERLDEDRHVYWMFDTQGMLLETAPMLAVPTVPVVKGFALLDPMIGTRVYPVYEDTAKLEPLLSLLRVMQAEEIWQDVGEIDVSLLSNIRFTYTGQYKVELGPPEAIEKKLQVMMLALEREEVSGRGAGTFNLAPVAEDGQARFVPDG